MKKLVLILMAITCTVCKSRNEPSASQTSPPLQSSNAEENLVTDPTPKKQRLQQFCEELGAIYDMGTDQCRCYGEVVDLEDPSLPQPHEGDFDGDGIANEEDRCPNTPRCANLWREENDGFWRGCSGGQSTSG